MKQLRPWMKTGEFRNCVICKQEFYVPKNAIESGRGNYCSRDCYYKSRKDKPMHPNTRKALLGKIPWCKGLTIKDDSRVAKFVAAGHKALEGMIPWNKDKKLPQYSGENNPSWVGDKVKNKGLHNWVRRRFKNPKVCEFCGEEKPLQLSNKNNLYRRNLEDWQWLCISCHKKYDLKRIRDAKNA